MEQRIVQEAADAIIYADARGDVRVWNRAAEKMFGYTAEEAIGSSLDLIVPEKHRSRHWDGYRRVMASGETRYAGSLLAVPAMRKDGSRVSIEFTVALIRDELGRVDGIAAVVRDAALQRGG